MAHEPIKFGKHIQDWVTQLHDWCANIFLKKSGNGFGNKVLIEDASGNITGSQVTATELTNLSNSTSNIQTQLNGKQPSTMDTASRVVVTDTSKMISLSSITTTELNQLDGVSSNIQQQIDGLRASIGEVGDATQFDTANVVLVTNANKAATTSSISTTKLGYLTDVTSDIQSQINSKCPKTLSTGNRVVITDSSGNITISTALTDPSKLRYLSGVTSDIQTQLNNKAPSSHTTNTTLHTNDTERSTWNAKQDTTLATANAVVVTDSSKKITASTTITTTELGYLDGVTSNVQTQLNAKAPSSHVGDGTHITSTERTNWDAASAHVSDTTIHITATERSNWNSAYNHISTAPKIWSTTVSLGGNKNGQVMTITHTLGVAPKMVYAHISTGGTTELNSGTSASPLTLFVFATVPLVGGSLSTNQIDILIPDVDTSASTKVTVTAIY